MQDLAGLKDLLAFLNFLKKKKISFIIEHCRPDAVMVSFTLVRVRVEVDFFEDHIEYSWFEGDESVASDTAGLFGIIAQHWD